MSIMDHFGYAIRPLVEFNLSIYSERASFLGWLSHMSERKRLAITLDPASSEPARFKNKRVQVSGDIREESEPEVVPISPPSTSRSSSTAAKSSKSHPSSLQALKTNQLAKTAAKEAERKREADSEDEYKPPTKKTNSSLRGALPDLKLVKSPTPVPMEGLLMLEVNVLNIFLKE